METESITYQRIKELCAKHQTTIQKLEKELGLSNASIQKWKYINTPSVNNIIKVANDFNVSIDFILGRTEIESNISDIMKDEDIISFQRARQKMSEQDKDRMMQMLRIGFEDAFSDE